jgi:hypothetical protein
MGHIILTNEGLVLLARGEGRIAGLVAKCEFGRLGYCVVVGAPDKLDSVTDRCVEGERHISKNTLGGSNPDGVRGATSVATGASSRRGRHVHGRRCTELGNAFCQKLG